MARRDEVTEHFTYFASLCEAGNHTYCDAPCIVTEFKPVIGKAVVPKRPSGEVSTNAIWAFKGLWYVFRLATKAGVFLSLPDFRNIRINKTTLIENTTDMINYRNWAAVSSGTRSLMLIRDYIGRHLIQLDVLVTFDTGGHMPDTPGRYVANVRITPSVTLAWGVTYEPFKVVTNDPLWIGSANDPCANVVHVVSVKFGTWGTKYDRTYHVSTYCDGSYRIVRL